MAINRTNPIPKVTETDPTEQQPALSAETGRPDATASDEVNEHIDLDALGRAWLGSQSRSGRRDLRDSRHAGHMDIFRELMDGTVGSWPPD